MRSKFSREGGASGMHALDAARNARLLHMRVDDICGSDPCTAFLKKYLADRQMMLAVCAQPRSHGSGEIVTGERTRGACGRPQFFARGGVGGGRVERCQLGVPTHLSGHFTQWNWRGPHWRSSEVQRSTLRKAVHYGTDEYRRQHMYFCVLSPLKQGYQR